MKKWHLAITMMFAMVFIMILSFEVTAASVLSGMEIVSGERGTILFLKSDNELECKITNSTATTITISLPGCIYGLQDFSYSKFDKKSQVTSLVASEKKNSAIVQLKITLKDPVDEKPVLKRKNSDIYVLLSKNPGFPLNWKAPTAFEKNSRPAVTQKTEPQDVKSNVISPNSVVVNKNEDRKITLLTDITMVYREQICRINFQFDSFVQGNIVRNRDSVVCSFKGVKSGLEKSIFEIHPRSVYKKIIITEKKGSENVLIAKIVVDTSEYIDRTSIVFEDSLHFTVMTINKSSYNAFWSAHSGSTWEYELTYVKPYEIDLKKMGERAEKDVALNFSNGPVFRVGEFFSEPPVVESVKNEITSDSPAVLPATAPDGANNLSKGESVAESVMASEMELDKGDSVLINADDVNVRQKPSVASVAITKVMKGMYAQRISSNNGWTKITVKGVSGWISSKFIEEPSPLEIVNREAISAEVQTSDTKIGRGMELNPAVQSLSNDSIAIQKVSQQIGGEEIVSEEKSDADQVIRYHQKGRDPFEPICKDSLMQRGKASIDQLQLVGVLIDGNDKVALFEDKTSKKQAFTLRENDAVENGKVLKVFPDRVVFLLTEFGISHSFTLRMKTMNTDEEARVR
jgi:hypothetical protein